jgi:hypothetical protein
MVGNLTTDPTRFLSTLSDAEQRQALRWLLDRHRVHDLEEKFGAPAEVILEAIARGSDLSQRGVLGLIAESYFRLKVIEKLSGWTEEPVEGHHAYDYLLTKGRLSVSVQVKRQRLELQQPKIYRRNSGLFAVETQRTRGGTNRESQKKTRPYRFGEFDVLAVSVQPSTRDWSDFRYTVQRWLLPDAKDSECLKVIQPLSIVANEDWADNFETAVAWFKDGSERRIRAR